MGAVGTRWMAWVMAVAVLLGLTGATASGGAGAAVGAGALTTATAVATAKPLIDWNCTSAGLTKPPRIILACGDGNAVADQMHWVKWTSTKAVGAGDLKQNDCTPDCADGAFHSYPARFTLSETTPVGHVKYFTKVTISFTGKTPLGKRVESVKDCWDTPPTSSQPRCPANLQGAG
jgi:hypothetical protein